MMRGSIKHNLLGAGLIAYAILNGDASTELPEGWPTIQQMAEPNNEMPDKWWGWRVPFFKWVLAARPSTEGYQHAADEYANIYGQWGWEE